MSRSKGPKKLTLRTNFTDDHVSLEVEINGDCVTTVEHLLEAVVADESRGTVLALAISRSIIAAQGGTLEATQREGEVTCVRIELPRFSSPRVGGLKLGCRNPWITLQCPVCGHKFQQSMIVLLRCPVKT
jgi:nitrogen-specific signal transduction histidine kinase